MVFVGFSSSITFLESMKLYKELRNSMIPWRLFELILPNSILTKNGTRVKTYLEKGERKQVKITAFRPVEADRGSRKGSG